jgi:hypothetical protein
MRDHRRGRGFRLGVSRQNHARMVEMGLNGLNVGRRADHFSFFVSTDGQTLASQDAELMAAGCAKLYAEKDLGAPTIARS